MALQFIFERITYIGFVVFFSTQLLCKIKTLNLNIHFKKKITSTLIILLRKLKVIYIFQQHFGFVLFNICCLCDKQRHTNRRPLKRKHNCIIYFKKKTISILSRKMHIDSSTFAERSCIRVHYWYIP